MSVGLSDVCLLFVFLSACLCLPAVFLCVVYLSDVCLPVPFLSCPVPVFCLSCCSLLVCLPSVCLSFSGTVHFHNGTIVLMFVLEYVSHFGIHTSIFSQQTGLAFCNVQLARTGLFVKAGWRALDLFFRARLPSALVPSNQSILHIPSFFVVVFPPKPVSCWTLFWFQTLCSNYAAILWNSEYVFIAL